MANQEHLNKLLNEDTDEWNQWRLENLRISPDLRMADLHEADLRKVRLSGADLSGADLREADLSGADLSDATLAFANLSYATLKEASLEQSDLGGANLSHANLKDASLYWAKLYGADLSHANLNSANLTEAHLSDANLKEADLSDAILRGAFLLGTILSDTNLSNVNLINAEMGRTVFGNNDLRTIKGLDTVIHTQSSYLDIYTLIRSQGLIPEIFLKGIGAPDTFIDYIHSLVNTPIHYYSCFISYSSKDEAFAKRLFADLQSNNVRSWFAPHDMRTGDKIRDRIDESIRIYDRLLLILSEASVQSHWVEHEVETALDKERDGHPNVLFPVRIDDTILSKKTGWANHIRTTRHIGDFTQWKDHDAYTQALERLLRDLKSEVKR